MAVTLRLTRRGQTKRPFYRIIATEKGSRRDGSFLEVVGTYNTMVEPHAITLKEDLVKKWLGNGAQCSQVVAGIIKKTFPGVLEPILAARVEKVKAARKARKLRAAKTAKPTKTAKAAK